MSGGHHLGASGFIHEEGVHVEPGSHPRSSSTKHMEGNESVMNSIVGQPEKGEGRLQNNDSPVGATVPSVHPGNSTTKDNGISDPAVSFADTKSPVSEQCSEQNNLCIDTEHNISSEITRNIEGCNYPSTTQEDIDMTDSASKTKVTTSDSLLNEDLAQKEPMSENIEESESLPHEMPVDELNESPSAMSTDVADEPKFEIPYDFTVPPTQVAWASIGAVNGCENFFKGCKWSPDGTCLLTNSEDKVLRVYDLPLQLYNGQSCENTELTAALQMREGETIYDYAWYPMMSSAQPDTCCIACCSRDTPVHLWDAFTGDIRCSYLSYSQMDELVAPYSLCFSLCGTKLYCGFNKKIRVFDISSPGRKCEERKTFNKTGQSGIISCLAMSPDQTMYAAGSYSKTVGVYEERSTNLLFLLQGQIGGVTHLVFSNDGQKLYSGGRKDTEILCWDIRNPGKVLYVLERNVETNQRMYFDLSRDGHCIASGNHDGTVRVWDTRSETQEQDGDAVLPPVTTFTGHTDTVNGASLHPCLPILATSSGQRRYDIAMDSDESESDEVATAESMVKLWWCKS